jgi:hypothetical protein
MGASALRDGARQTLHAVTRGPRTRSSSRMAPCRAPSEATVTGTVNEAHRPDESGALRRPRWLEVSQSGIRASRFPHSATAGRVRGVGGGGAARADSLQLQRLSWPPPLPVLASDSPTRPPSAPRRAR